MLASQEAAMSDNMLEAFEQQKAALSTELIAVREQERAYRAELEAAKAAEQEAQRLALQHALSQQPDTLRVFGTNAHILRKLLKGNSLALAPVHADVYALLQRALPAQSEEEFCELCSMLVVQLHSNTQTRKQVIATAQSYAAASATKQYYLDENDELSDSRFCVNIPLLIKNSYSAIASLLLTAWALEWQQAMTEVKQS
jgi:hypothetical protein